MPGDEGLFLLCLTLNFCLDLFLFFRLAPDLGLSFFLLFRLPLDLGLDLFLFCLSLEACLWFFLLVVLRL